MSKTIFVNTNGFDDLLLESYCKVFNQVFEKSFTPAYFIQKYQTVVFGFSFHGLLIDELNEVKGGVSIIPYQYIVKKEKKTIGLAVDAFVHPAFRTDAFVLAEMYALAASEAAKAGLFGVISVPNSIAHPYWKNFVGWQDIGALPYYALPLKLEKFINIPPPLAKIANIGFMIWGKSTASFCFKNHRLFNFNINKAFLEHRTYEWHQVIKDESTIFVIRTQYEDYIKTTYILGCFNLEMKWSSAAFNKALQYIISDIHPDIILFIGNMPFKQISLFKIPNKKIPKVLPLTFDFLQGKCINQLDYTKLKNWDFSLINYDVR